MSSEFKETRLKTYEEHCTSLRQSTLGTAVYFPDVITTIVFSYYRPTPQEHFYYVIFCGKICLKFGYTMIRFNYINLKVLFQQDIRYANKLMAEFDDNGFGEKMQEYLKYDYFEWTLEETTKALCNDLLHNYLNVAQQLTNSFIS